MAKRKWNMQYFQKVHTDLHEKIRRYRLTNRGRGVLCGEIKQRMDDPMSLNATNLEARMAFAKCLERHLRRFFPSDEDPKAFFVTLACKRHAIPLESASEFVVSDVSRWANGVLDRFDHFGAVDLAFYPRGTNGAPTVAWHAHALVWGVSAEDISAAEGRYDYDAQAYLPGGKWFHFKPVRRERLLERALYIAKAPVREYYAYAKMEDIADQETGEFLKVPTGEYRQKKRPIRPGQYAKVANILSKQTLDDLVFGGGSGASLRRKVLADLADDLSCSETKRLCDMRHRLGLPPVPSG